MSNGRCFNQRSNAENDCLFGGMETEHGLCTKIKTAVHVQNIYVSQLPREILGEINIIKILCISDVFPRGTSQILGSNISAVKWSLIQQLVKRLLNPVPTEPDVY